MREKEPFALGKEDEIICIYHFPVGAAYRWELLFQPRLAKVIYRSQRDENPQKLSVVAGGLLRGELDTQNSTTAAYGELLAATKGSSSLAVMERQERYLEEMLRTTACLETYLKKRETFPVHKKKFPREKIMAEKEATEPEYRGLQIKLAQLYRKEQWDEWMRQMGYGLKEETTEQNVLQRVTATLFLLISQIRLPALLSEKRYDTYFHLQKNLREMIGFYLRRDSDRTEDKFEEGKPVAEKLPLYILESREENEIRIPLRKRLEGEIQSVDIAAIACLSLFSNKRHVMDRLLERGIPVRLVITDKDSDAAKFVFSQFVGSASDTEQEDILNHVSSAIRSRKKYSNLCCRKTGFVLPTAIFIVHEKEAEKSSAKVDLYGFDTFDDDRRTLYVTGADKENFEYFVRQFEYIWEHASPLTEEKTSIL